MKTKKKFLVPIGLTVVFQILCVAYGFSATSTNPPVIKPQPAPIIIRPQPAPKEKSANPQPAPKEKPATSQPAQKEKSAPVAEPVAVYKKTCSQCHLAFPPEFLPAASWSKLMGSTENHFEGSIDIDDKTKGVILAYLKGKGAESSQAKIPQKIMASLDGRIPLRITEVPYIIKKHRKYKEEFKRKPIGSFSNCGACHMLADEWNFGRRIMIPREESLPKNTP